MAVHGWPPAGPGTAQGSVGSGEVLGSAPPEVSVSLALEAAKVEDVMI